MRFQQASPHHDTFRRMLADIPVITEECFGAIISNANFGMRSDLETRAIWRKKAREKLKPLITPSSEYCRLSLPFPHPVCPRFVKAHCRGNGYDFNAWDAPFEVRRNAWLRDKMAGSRSSRLVEYPASQYRMRFEGDAPAVWYYSHRDVAGMFISIRFICPNSGREWGKITIPQRYDVVTPWPGQPALPADSDGPCMYGLVRTGPTEFVLPIENIDPANVAFDNDHQSALQRTLGEITLLAYRALERSIAVAEFYVNDKSGSFTYYPDHRFTVKCKEDGFTAAFVYGLYKRAQLIDPFDLSDWKRQVYVFDHDRNQVMPAN